MYVSVALLFTVALPLVLASVDGARPDAAFLDRLGKWEPCSAARGRGGQAVQPAVAAGRIFGLSGSGAWVVVRELGFANLALGLIDLASGFHAPWRAPAAPAGCVVHGLAGINPLLRTRPNRLEDIPRATDFAAFGVLAAFKAGGALAMGRKTPQPAKCPPLTDGEDSHA
jgi:hypothetical protein